EPKIPLDILETITSQRGVSEAERAVLVLALDGHSTEEMAKSLGISSAAVRKRLGEVYKKFAVPGSSRGKLAELHQILCRLQPHRESQKIAEKRPSVEDWGSAPALEVFYGREDELCCLEQWIVSDGCRLVALVGMGGIGKTALALKLAERIKHHFEVVIWRSLFNPLQLSKLLEDWLSILSDTQESPLPERTDDRISRLLECLSQRRCLLILDNVETILQSDQLTGYYQDRYKDYGDLFTRIGVGRPGDPKHQSCLMLTSQEKLREIALYQDETLPVRSLPLKGLTNDEAKEILDAKGLKATDDDRKQLINRYIGNPLALRIVATTIQELFDGDVKRFLQQSTILYSGLRNLLDNQFARLSDKEKRVLYWLAISRGEQVSLTELQRDILPPTDQSALLEILESLTRRSLIGNTTVFSLHPAVMEYVTGRFVGTICNEICNEIRTSLTTLTDAPTGEKPKVWPLFNSHALIKAQAKDYVREKQTQEILNPILNQLEITLGSKQEIQDRLRAMLDQLRGKSLLETGYAGGNIFNLLRQLTSDLSQYDFSNLTIRQAYLKGVNLHNVNFANSNLAKSAFIETFGSILTVAISPTYHWLATGDTKGEIRIWQIIDGEQRSLLAGHDGWVRSLRFSQGGRRLVSGSDDGTVKLWDTDKLQCLQIFRGHADAVRTVAVADHVPIATDGSRGMIASGSNDKTIRLWDMDDGECIRELPGHTSWVQSLDFSPDHRYLVSGSGDQTIRIWDMATGKCLRVLKGHDRTVRSVKFSPDGKLLASGSSDQTIQLWDTTTWQVLKTLTGHNGKVWSVDFSPNSELLASGSDDQTVRLWDIALETCVKILEGHSSRVWSVAFGYPLSSDEPGGIVASGSDDQTVRIWDIDKLECRRTLQGYSNSPRSVTIFPGFDLKSPATQWAASGGDDQLVRVWDFSTGECLQELHGHTSRVGAVAVSPDRQILASGSDDQTVRIWDVNTWRCLDILHGHTNWVRAVGFSPDSNVLASGSDDRTIRLWATATGKLLTTLAEHGDWVWTVAFSPDGQWLASGSADYTVRIWNLKTYKCVHVLKEHTDWVRSVVFSSDSQLLASGGGDRTVKIWDVASAQCLKTLRFNNRIRSLVFSPDSTQLICATEDKAIERRIIETDQRLDSLLGHEDSVRSISLSADGTALVSGSRDGTIRLWNLHTTQAVTYLRAKRPYEGMNITGVKGLTEAQKSTLKALGAVENSGP
ncbi:MAG: NB-ARC domain-containing protein, partial [Cyanobacteria bacterium]|nr:NB-ARC domain-containing protein [Cyanobacteriota bacterium]MDW8202575.1 NB-ARC domain-containing protein [Cyanobacteriota bacterium SKYGB_h_bin112]